MAAVFLFSSIFFIISTVNAVSFTDNGSGVFWSLNCDFNNKDLSSQSSKGEECGGLCQSTSQCTHFTWTDYQGGTCWMKKGDVSLNDATVKTDSNAVCGYLKASGGGVQGTYWAEQSDAGGCQLPGSVSYAFQDALALGQQPALQYLVWRSGLCGQVLSVDCGHGTVNAVVASTCNLGSPSCGVDMIGRTWRTATANQSPGTAQCSVSLTNQNPINGGSPLCFHRPNSDINNAYFTAVGVLNTSGRIVRSASLAGIQGTLGNDAWFLFNSNGAPLFTPGATVTFIYEDGSQSSFQLSQCSAGGSPHIFS